MSVDLPAPFSPMSAWTVPARPSRWTSSSARTPGNVFEIPSIRRRTSSAIACLNPRSDRTTVALRGRRRRGPPHFSPYAIGGPRRGPPDHAFGCGSGHGPGPVRSARSAAELGHVVGGHELVRDIDEVRHRLALDQL